MQFLSFSESNTQITDEIINVSDSNPINLRKDIFYNQTGKKVVISTAAGGGGTVLTETTDWETPAGTAYADGDLPSSISPDLAYTQISIVNATYHNTDLYVSYYPIADLISPTNLNTHIRYITRNLTNDISATDITEELPSSNTIETGDRCRYQWQGGDGSHTFELNPASGWTLEYNDIDIDATAQARIGEGTGFIEVECKDAQEYVWEIVAYSDSDGGNFSAGKFKKDATGMLTQWYDFSVGSSSFVTTTFPIDFADTSYVPTGNSISSPSNADITVKFKDRAVGGILVASTVNGSFSTTDVSIHLTGNWY